MYQVIEYAEHHKDDPPAAEESTRPRSADDMSEWDRKFINVEQSLLFDIILASNFLDMKPLLDLGGLSLSLYIGTRFVVMTAAPYRLQSRCKPNQRQER